MYPFSYEASVTSINGEVELLQYRPPQADVCSTHAIPCCFGYFIFCEWVKSYRACTQLKKASEKFFDQNGDRFSF